MSDVNAFERAMAEFGPMREPGVDIPPGPPRAIYFATKRVLIPYALLQFMVDEIHWNTTRENAGGEIP